MSTPSLHAALHALSPYLTARPQPLPPNPFNSSDHWTDGYTDQMGADLTMNAFSKWSVFILVKTKQRHDFWTHQAPAFFAMVFTQRCKQQVSKFSHAGFWRHRFRKSPFPSILHANGHGAFLKRFVFLRLQFLIKTVFLSRLRFHQRFTTEGFRINSIRENRAKHKRFHLKTHYCGRSFTLLLKIASISFRVFPLVSGIAI